MKRIFLTGFMGSGKSTVGAVLAEQLKADFADTDAYIEEKEAKRISDIFAEQGEAHFRSLETKALEEVHERIVSTGGGIIERPENIRLMKEKGIVVYLSTTFAEISRRLDEDETRPLWKQDLDGKKLLFSRRLPVYEQAADIIVATDGRPADDIAAEILHKLKEE